MVWAGEKYSQTKRFSFKKILKGIFSILSPVKSKKSSIVINTPANTI